MRADHPFNSFTGFKRHIPSPAVILQLPSLAPRATLPRMNNRGTGFIKEDPWRVLRIMGEFVESFETLSHLNPAVTVWVNDMGGSLGLVVKLA